jgi:hypothetical protein
MATKTKSASGNAKKKKKAPVSTLTIFIRADGSHYPDPAYVDAKHKKHPYQVEWQVEALDPLQTWTITLDKPPAPFTAGNNGPFTTVDGKTGPYPVDPTLLTGKSAGYTYKQVVTGQKANLFSAGGGIIIDS